MNRLIKATLTWSGLMFVFPLLISAQEMPVNPLSGNAEVIVPLYNLTAGGMSVPISLVYQGGGIRVGQKSDNVGLGWSLMAEGKVTREIRGRVDDAPKGWLRNNNASAIGSSNINSNTCSNETAAYNFIALNHTERDMEPDLFRISAPGLSVTFLFDNNGQIKTMPYSDVKIQVNYRPDNTILGFVVKLISGTEYVFDYHSKFYKYLATDMSNLFDLPPYDYLLGEVGTPISGTTEWMLTSIKSATGEEIKFEYEGGYAGNHVYVLQKSSSFIINEGVSPIMRYSFDNNHKTLYLEHSNQERAILKRIVSGKVRIDFIFDDVKYKMLNDLKRSSYNPPLSKINVYYLNGAMPFQSINFTYQYAYDHMMGYGSDPFDPNPIPYSENRVHLLLDEILILKEALAINKRKFTYFLDTPPVGWTGGSKLYTRIGHDAKPDSWGYAYGIDDRYFFGKSHFPGVYIHPNLANEKHQSLLPIPGQTSYAIGEMLNYTTQNKQEHLAYAQALSLRTFDDEMGLKTVFSYELNSFIEPNTGTTIHAGGIRVKRVDQYKPNNIVPPQGQENLGDLVNSYRFNYDKVNGQTSGKAIYIPRYGFTAAVHRQSNNLLQYHQLTGSEEDKWKKLFVLTNRRLTPNETALGSEIAYERVSVESMNGKMIYEYDLSGTEGYPTSSGIYQTNSSIARASCTNPGLLKSGFYTNPYAPNMYLPYERGLIKNIQYWNTDGQKVKEKWFTYSDVTGIQTPVKAIRYDKLKLPTGHMFVYSVYTIRTQHSKVLINETERLYNTDNPSLFVENQGVKIYDPSYAYLKEQSYLNSDGVQYKSVIKYAGDYSVGTSTNPAALALLHLQQNGGRGVPVESYSSTTQSGVTTFTGGSLTVFERSTIKGQVLALPKQQYALKAGNGLTTAQFSPSTISSGNFVFDNDYELVNTTSERDSRGKVTGFTSLLTNQGMHWGHNGAFPILEIQNGFASDVSYSDFESGSEYACTPSGNNVSYSTDRAFGKALNMVSSISLRDTLYWSANPQTVRISAWIKSSTAGTLSITATRGAGTSNGSIAYANTSGQWRYYETTLNTSALVSTQLGVIFNITTNQAITIDDVLIRPTATRIATTSYRFPYGVSVNTDDRGKSTYTEYEFSGMKTLLKDHIGGIVSIKETNLPISDDNLLKYGATFVKNDKEYGYKLGDTVIARAVYGNIPGAFYWWQIGSGTWNQGPPTVQFVLNSTHVADLYNDNKIRLRVSLGNGQFLETSHLMTIDYSLRYDICRSGYVRRDLCMFEEDEIVNECYNLPGLIGGFTVAIYNVTGGNPNSPITYEWYKKTWNGNDILVSTNQTYGVQDPQESFTVYCLIKSNGGTLIKTLDYTFIAYQSNCQLN